MNKILILLSTYNGNNYLREQIDSLYAQIGVDFHILVRDDGSKDDTLRILKMYEKEKGKITILDGENVGAARSFYALMKYAFEHMLKYDYFSFCDQDDVWNSDKLFRSLNLLEKSSNTYKLYFSAAEVSDKNLKYLNTTIKPKNVGYRSCLITTITLGCTMVISKELLGLSYNVAELKDRAGDNKTNLPLHDAWIYAFASYLEADIIYDESPTMKYRQHGNNVTSYKKSFISKYNGAFRRYNKHPNINSNMAKLLTNYEYLFSQEKIDYLRLFANYMESFKNTIKCFIEFDLSSREIFDRILFRFLILFRML
jgi:glycosyltransferase involved in cell wall biosynthesis